MTRGTARSDDAERLRQFKAEFFKALAHPLRIWILELLRNGPMSVTQIQEATRCPELLACRSSWPCYADGTSLRPSVAGRRTIYSVADVGLFDMLDVARRLFNTHLSDTIDLLRLVEDEAGVAIDR